MSSLLSECPRQAKTFADGVSPSGDGARRKRWDLLATALLVCSACALHGHGLSLGFWFDDHTHLELCRQYGFENLASGNRFDWNGRIAHAWWAKHEIGWAYFRPLTVGLRTVLWQMFGQNPMPFHIVHLALFSLSVALFYGLLRRCGWGTVTASVAVMLFVLHPANALTTPWLANDGPVLVGLWTLTGLWLMHASAQAGHRRPFLLAGVFLCYALAMLSRENGIVLGPLLLVFDALGAGAPGPGEAAVQPARWRRRLAIYAGLAAEGVTYLFVRAWCLGPMPLPRRPYVHWPWEPGFAAWMPYKLLNELVCLPLGLPFFPIVEVPWWQAHPATAAAGVVAVIGLALVFLAPLRRSRLMWGMLAGIALAQAPTELVFSAAYNYYLATAGWAVLVAAWTRALWPSRPRLVKATLGALAASYLVGLWAGAWTIHSAATAERLLRADVLATNPGTYPERTRLFFINMPFFAAEVAPSLRLAAERPDLEVYPLTMTPHLFFPMTETVVAQEDDYTLLLRADEHTPLFAGDFGDLVQLGWFGACRSDFPTGAVTLAPAAGPMPFRVEIVDADCRGVWAVRFVFEHSLDDPGYRFFLGSPRAMGQELRFGRIGSGPDAVALGCPDSLFLSGTYQEARLRGEDFDRVRRTQITTDVMTQLLTDGPFR